MFIDKRKINEITLGTSWCYVIEIGTFRDLANINNVK